MNKISSKMDEEAIYLKNTNTYKVEEKTDSNNIKNYIIGFLIIFLIISLCLNSYLYLNLKKSKTHNLRGSEISIRQGSINPNNFLKYNTYNIFIENIQDFFT